MADASEAMSAADPLAVPVPDSVRAFLRSRWLATSGAALIGMAEALRTEPDRVLALRRTGLPVLVLHGEADDAWSPAEQREMAERLGAAYAVVPGARHSPAVEAPEPTAQALLAFWSGRLAGRAHRGLRLPAGRCPAGPSAGRGLPLRWGSASPSLGLGLPFAGARLPLAPRPSSPAQRLSRSPPEST